MEKESMPITSYLCSISQQGKNGFSVYGGNKGGFSSNVLEGMPYTKDSGPYLMTYDPKEKSLTIKTL